MSDLTHEQINNLREYAEADGTEYGEAINAMLDVLWRSEYIQNITMEEAIEKELKAILADYKKNYKWVERKETFTHTSLELVPITDE